jgi:hypothetical protein
MYCIAKQNSGTTSRLPAVSTHDHIACDYGKSLVMSLQVGARQLFACASSLLVPLRNKEGSWPLWTSQRLVPEHPLWLPFKGATK